MSIFFFLNFTIDYYLLGSKIIYIARAQKKSEREQILRRHFEEKRKEQMLKCKVASKICHFHFWYAYSLCLLLTISPTM